MYSTHLPSPAMWLSFISSSQLQHHGYKWKVHKIATCYCSNVWYITFWVSCITTIKLLDTILLTSWYWFLQINYYCDTKMTTHICKYCDHNHSKLIIDFPPKDSVSEFHQSQSQSFLLIMHIIIIEFAEYVSKTNSHLKHYLIIIVLILLQYQYLLNTCWLLL